MFTLTIKITIIFGKFVFVHKHAFCEGFLSSFNIYTKVSQSLEFWPQFVIDSHTVFTPVYLKYSKINCYEMCMTIFK